MRIVPAVMMTLLLASGFPAMPQQQNAGNTPTGFTMIPPSPELQPLMNSVDIPVSLFHGIPDITLPLYTIKQGTLQIPISISYSGGGIKVDDLSGSIGIGWTLNAGGAVARSVCGIPDEAPNCNHLHLSNGNATPLRGIFNMTDLERDSLWLKVVNRSVEYNPVVDFERGIPYTICGQFEDGKLDLSNDIYRFNCMGLSGTFIYDINKNATISSTPTVKLDEMHFGTTTPTAFYVTDASGNRYTFDQMEESRWNYSYFNGGSLQADSLYYISAWHLGRIESPQGDEVTFIYSDGETRRENAGLSETYRYQTDNPPYETTNGDFSSISVTYMPRLLSEIRTKTSRVAFEYAGGILKAIRVYDTSAESRCVKQITLEQSSHKVGTYTTHEGISEDVVRTFLDKVAETDSSGHCIYLYGMEYNSSIADDGNYFLAKDEWSYYNGACNKSLLRLYGNSNRKVNPITAVNGVLNRITYATGGHTELDWESNDYSFLGSAPVGSEDSTVMQKENHRLRGKKAVLSDISLTSTTTSAFDSQLSISHYDGNENVTIEIDLNKFVKPLMDGGTGLDDRSNEYYYHHSSLTSQEKSPRLELVSPKGETVGCWCFDYVQCANATSGMVTVNLNSFKQTGVYRLKLLYPYNWMTDRKGGSNSVTASDVYNYMVANDAVAYVDISISRSTTVKGRGAAWGGLRIASIKSVPGDEGIHIHRPGNRQEQRHNFRKARLHGW